MPVNPNDLPILPESGVGMLSDSAGEARLYGALVDKQLEARAEATRICKQRRRVNVLAALMALLLPWGLFVFVFGTVSFYIHYAAPLTTSLVMGCILILSLNAAWTGIQAWRRGLEGYFYRLYVGVAVSYAVFFGWVFGDINFWQFMQPSYSIDHLATYTNVDPSSQRLWSGEDMAVDGKRYQDAGKVYFAHNAVLDRRKAASFKDGDLYCVAPIVNPGCTKNCGYDFWAVGINCCSEFAADFRCGAYNSTRARSGLRQVVETWRPWFRLAVLQAEGTHGLTSRHPLFFHWVEEPVKELNAWKLMGYRRLIIGMVITFLLNACALGFQLRAARLRF